MSPLLFDTDMITKMLKLIVVLMAALIGLSFTPAHAVDTGPAKVILSQVALYDSTVMQGFAKGPNGSWFATQVSQGGMQHAHNGDITMTHLTSSGAILSHMFLQGFGHGISIGVEPVAGEGTYIWTETESQQDPGDGYGYGTAIARFLWTPGETLTADSPDVEVFHSNPGSLHQTVSLDLADGLIAERYVSPTLGVPRIALYHLADFKSHTYPAIWRVSVPPSIASQTSQGWTILPGASQISYLTGDAYSATNKAPGDAFLNIFDNTGAIVSVTPLTEDTGLLYREPESTTFNGNQVCHGFASGLAGARLASFYCLT